MTQYQPQHYQESIGLSESKPLEKRVSFHPNVRVLCVPKHTPAEAADVWYCQRDFSSFKKEIRRAQKAWDKGVSLKHYCLRGIEHFVFPEWGQQRSNRRANALLHVLNSQWMENICAVEDLALSLAGVTEASAFEARMKAERDADEAGFCLYAHSNNTSNPFSRIKKDMTSSTVKSSMKALHNGKAPRDDRTSTHFRIAPLSSAPDVTSRIVARTA